MSALAFEWSPTGPQKVRRAVGLVLVLFGAFGGYLAPRGHWFLMIDPWVLTLGFFLALPATYRWPWRTEHPVVTTIATCWFLLQAVVFLIEQLHGGARRSWAFAMLISGDAFLLFIVVSWVFWLRRGRQSRGRPGSPDLR